MHNSSNNQNNSSNAHIMWAFELLHVWTTHVVQRAIVQTSNSSKS